MSCEFCIHLISQARTLEEQNRLLRNVLRRDGERRKKLQASGIDFEFPALVR